MFTEQNNEELCERILNENKNIQSVAIINRHGRIDACCQRNSCEPFPGYTSELFLMHCVLQISIGKDFDEDYGPVHYHISERPNLMILSFPIGDKIMLTTANKDVGIISLARKITNVINKPKSSFILT